MLPLLLIFSFLGTCGTVFYILYTHVGERKSSVSLHVAANKRSHTIFALGHLIGGICFLVFVYKFFFVTYGSLALLLLASIGFLVEQIQAFLPNNLRFEKIHTIAAVSMAVSMAAILMLAPIVVQLRTGWLGAYICLALIWVITGVYALVYRQRFYQAQVVFFSVFYLFLLILLYGGI